MAVEQLQGPRPLHIVTEQPKGWNRSSVPKFRQMIADLSTLPPEKAHEELLTQQRKRWKEMTGEEPEDSHFTIIMPIHNEEDMLSSAIGTFLLSDIPSTVHATVIFVTNACTDQSPQIVNNHLQQLGEVTKKPLEGTFSDPNLKQTYSSVQIDNTEYLHLDTSTQGKASAVTTGNEIALQKGDRIAISMDANNFIEPDAIPKLYGAIASEINNATSTVIISGKDEQGIRPSIWSKHIGRQNTVNTSSSQRSVNGWLFAWDTHWVDSIGGIPKVRTEDYALGMIARSKGKEIDWNEDAVSWGYRPNSIIDTMKARIRYYQGARQLSEQYPEVAPFIADNVHLRTFPKRVSDSWEKIKERPLRAPFQIAAFLIWEETIRRAKKEYERNPRSETWEEIPSTKRRAYK